MSWSFDFLEESEETLRKTKEVKERAEEKFTVLESKMKNAEAEREKELKAAQQKLNQAKSRADVFYKRLKERQQVRSSVSRRTPPSLRNSHFTLSPMCRRLMQWLLSWRS